MPIRKISIGSDYKSSAMHYIVGQNVINGEYSIHLIDYNADSGSYLIYIQNKEEVYLWKEFNKNIPISAEFNINF
tara:strand:+ start:117 stop:341 length:225 start_codon:yes stop_codon:yes gene_type:complete